MLSPAAIEAMSFVKGAEYWLDDMSPATPTQEEENDDRATEMVGPPHPAEVCPVGREAEGPVREDVRAATEEEASYY